MISLYLGWETFNWFQVLGFIGKKKKKKKKKKKIL